MHLGGPIVSLMHHPRVQSLFSHLRSPIGLILLLGCADPAPTIARYAGGNSLGESAWIGAEQGALSNLGTGEQIWAHELADVLDLDGVYTADGHHAVELPGKILVTDAPLSASGQTALSVALSPQLATDLDQPIQEQLLMGDWIWLHMDQSGDPDGAWGFMRVDAQGMHLSTHGPDSDPYTMPYGESQVAPEWADRRGVWSITPGASWHLSVQMDDGEVLQGSIWPGKMMVLNGESGMLIALWNPTAHLHLDVAAGIYKFVDATWKDGELISRGVGSMVIYEREVSWYRELSDGTVEQRPAILDWAPNVGSLFGLLFTDQEDRIYTVHMEDVVLIFSFGGDPSTSGTQVHFGLGAKIGQASLGFE
jgi:hypothetical protein